MEWTRRLHCAGSGCFSRTLDSMAATAKRTIDCQTIDCHAMELACHWAQSALQSLGSFALVLRCAGKLAWRTADSPLI